MSSISGQTIDIQIVEIRCIRQEPVLFGIKNNLLEAPI